MRVNDTVNQFSALWAEARQGFVTALPNILTALIILAIGWGLAWVLRRLLLGVFRRMGSRMHDQKAAGLAAGGTYWLILIATVVVALDALDLPVLRRSMEVVASHLPRFAIAVALVLGGVVLGRLASTAIIKAGFRLTLQQSRRLAQLTRVSIVVAAALIAAAQLG